MKVAIHHREGSFTERWIKFCINNNVDHILINAFDSKIIEELISEEITHLMWHINHASIKDLTVFPYLMNSIENIGIKCFPDFNTRWHFDNKIAQKYLLESIGAPLVSGTVIYDREEALAHVSSIKFPIVSKLKRGAGATNVKLLKSKAEALIYINKMFGNGINSNAGNLGNFTQKARLAKKIKNPFKLVTKVFRYLKKNTQELKISSNEKGYFYYQEFQANNYFDIRVIVIGKKAFAIKRMNRKNDFKASGSGKIIYDHNQIDHRCLAIAFNTNKQLDLQCIAYDFVFNEFNKPLIVEMCFGFSINAYDFCKGYWSEDLIWHEQNFNPQEWMIKEFIEY